MYSMQPLEPALTLAHKLSMIAVIVIIIVLLMWYIIVNLDDRRGIHHWRKGVKIGGILIVIYFSAYAILPRQQYVNTPVVAKRLEASVQMEPAGKHNVEAANYFRFETPDGVVSFKVEDGAPVAEIVTLYKN